MEIKASVKNLRISPFKVRLVANLVRNQPVEKALHDLQFSAKRAAVPLRKLVKSAVANAKENSKMTSTGDLYISEIRVDEAGTFKRWRFASRGRVHPIKKRGSHVSIKLSERKQSKNQEPRTKK